MTAFLTGSHRYGTPNEDSDIDLVIRVDKETLNILRKLADKADPVKQCERGPSDFDPTTKPEESKSLRFGKLNLICCDDDLRYSTFLLGTLQLGIKQPVPRDEACDHFHRLRNASEEIISDSLCYDEGIFD